MGIQFECDVCKKEIAPEQLIIQIAANWHTLKRNLEDTSPCFEIFNLYDRCADILLKVNEQSNIKTHKPITNLFRFREKEGYSC